MSEIKNGGPAFPIVEPNGDCSVVLGISMRDYFAAKAMQGMLAYPGDKERGNHHNNNTPNGIANMAFVIADAMLRVREAI